MIQDRTIDGELGSVLINDHSANDEIVPAVFMCAVNFSKLVPRRRHSSVKALGELKLEMWKIDLWKFDSGQLVCA